MNDAPPLNSVFNAPIGQLLEMDEPQLRQMLAKAELLCRWLRGVIRLKSNKGRK